MNISWLDRARRLPVGFAQVREDPTIDARIIGLVGDGVRVLMVASGGCTAALLAGSPKVQHLHLVDPNPAQIALTRLKLGLLASSDSGLRLRVLGHAEMGSEERLRSIAARLVSLGYAADALGPQDCIGESGPDHTGRYELLFAELRRCLSAVRPQIQELLELRDPVEQARRVAPSAPLGAAMDAAFQNTMALPNLVALFGEGATSNRRLPFAEHFALQARSILGRQPAAGNPFLSQVLLGEFQSGAEHAWLRSAVPAKLPRITWQIASMLDVLGSIESEFDVIHLSNILDWLSPDAASETLDRAARAVRRGGWLVIRQLNSTLDIRALGGRIAWESQLSDSLLEGDRSFFYRAIHVGRRP